MLPTVFTASESSISLQDILPSLDESGSTNSKCSSFFDALGSILPRSRTSSPMKIALFPLSPTSLWKAAKNFFVGDDTILNGSPQAAVEDALDDQNLSLDSGLATDRADLLEDLDLEDNIQVGIDSEGSDGDSEESGEDIEADCVRNHEKDVRWNPPTVQAVKEAHKKIKVIIHPSRGTGKGYKDPKLALVLRGRLENMQRFMWAYINSESPVYDKWEVASLDTAQTAERGPYFACRLRQWTRDFVADEENLPLNIHGSWNKSRVDDEDLKQEILTHLQGIGKYICAQDVARYMNLPEVKKRYGMKKGITDRTARNWLNRMGYRWTLEPSGQYVDGHEREDVVTYRQRIFLPRWKAIEPSLRIWTQDGAAEDMYTGAIPQIGDRKTVVWFHDESTFYANDRRKRRWVHNSETAVPRAKGEGASLMVSDFISADYGWLRSPCGKEAARVLFKAGKNRDGYFTNENILEQTQLAMEITKKYYPDDEHVFIFDNATTHLKRPPTAISARKMTKNPSTTFGVEITVIENGKIRYAPDGKPEKKKIPMSPGKFADGTPHNFYNEDGVFKGMTRILQERGLTNEAKLNAECKIFKCPEGATRCCQRRVLYNQPDFAEQGSGLEILGQDFGFEVIFLPKFHCELNFIEQCWGHAKRVYRQYPVSSKEEDLEKNLLTALESVPLSVMRKYVVALSFCYLMILISF